MPAGRPTKMTAETVKKLEDAFMWGCSDVEACSYAGITKPTLYAYEEKYPNFHTKKEVLKNNVKMRAKRVISDSLDNGDLASAHKVIDRSEGKKVAVTGADGDPLKTITTIEYVIRKDPPD